jgi:Protein of unknown function (DUF1826)
MDPFASPSPSADGLFPEVAAGAPLGWLDQLHRPELELVSWRRALPPWLGPMLQGWAARFPARYERTLATSASPRELDEAVLGLGEDARRWLAQDLAGLLAGLAQVAQTRHLRVWFGAVRSDQCRKFHVDNVRYRLVTTYVGPGTEWVPDTAVRREALDHPPSCPCDANQAIVRDSSAIRHAVPGEVLVMKGGRHPHRRGAVHRSPPIEGTGQTRVVLIASVVEDAG